jgi:malate synthase
MLDSAELASALTAETYAARILGVSKMLRVPIQVQWVGSGNNTELTTELYRRVNDIRMDAQVERPEDRDVSEFRIKDLKEWTIEHQAQQVQAALTIIQYWVNLGMPKGTGSKGRCCATHA